MPFVQGVLCPRLVCAWLCLCLWAPGVLALSVEQQRALQTVGQLSQQSRHQAEQAWKESWRQAEEQQNDAYQLALLDAQAQLQHAYRLSQALQTTAARGMQMALEQGDLRQQRRFRLHQANANALLGQYNEAHAAHMALAAEALKDGDSAWRLQVQLALARSRINVGQIDAATAALNALLVAAEQQGDMSMVAAVHQTRAQLHHHMQAYAESLENYRAALQAAPIQALQVRANYRLGIAQTLNILQQRDAAFAELTTARVDLKSAGDTMGEAFADLLEGYFWLKAGNLTKVEAPYLRCLARYKALDDPLGLSNIHALLSGAYHEMGLADKALSHAREAVALAEARQDVSAQWDAHATLADALAATGRFEAAFQHMAKAERALLKSARLNAINETNRLREEFDAERRQQSNEMLTERLGLEAARLRAEERMTMALTGLLVVLGLALAWSVWMYRRTRDLAQRDGLTGLANRRTLLAHAQRERVRALRYQQPVALVVLDLDLFKQLNDSKGHAAGDRALKYLAELCRQLLRESDVAGRIGGEEFALVLANTDAAGALQLAERLRERLASSASVDWQAGELTASFGVAQYAVTDATLEQWFSRADQALYAAKRGGRNRCIEAEAQPVEPTEALPVAAC